MRKNLDVHYYISSLHDWLTAQCRHKRKKSESEKQSCMDDAYRSELARLSPSCDLERVLARV